MGSIQQEHIYFEGRFVPAEDAKISVKTHAFLYGTSIFEGIRGYWLADKRQIAVFRMADHYKRLLANSRNFYLTPELSLDQLCEVTVELIRRNRPDTDIYIRPTLYKATEHITPTLLETATDFCVWIRPFGNYLDIDQGLSVCVSNWRRVPDNAIPARAKAGGAYMNTALAVSDARKTGFDDAVFLTDAGTVSEGSAMNLFLVRNNQLHTPSRTEDILEGITRETLMTIARNELGIDTVERVIDRTELYHADEAFFCGTGAQVAPITSFDHRPVANGDIGSMTRQLQALYFDVVKNRLPRYGHWITSVQL